MAIIFLSFRNRIPRRSNAALLSSALTGSVLFGLLVAVRASAAEPTLRATLGNGHTGPVAGIAYSPDGRLLVSGSDDKTVKLWDTATGTCIATMDDHPGRVWCIAFSPDGKSVASGHDDDTVKLWDVAARKRVATLGRHPSKKLCVMSLAFSPDSKTLAAGNSDGSMKLWNLRNENSTTVLIEANNVSVRGLVQPNWVSSVAFSPDGKTLVSADFDGKVTIWDVATGKSSGSLATVHGGAHQIAFSPDGKMLASGNHDGSTTIWDFVARAAGTTISTRRIGRMANPSFAFSPDGRTFATAGGSKGADCVELWSVSSGEPIAKPGARIELPEPLFVAFSPDGKTLAAGAYNGRIYLSDVATGTKVATLGGHLRPVSSLLFSPNGKSLASFGGGGVMLWDIASGRTTVIFEDSGAFAFSPDGKKLALSPAGGGILVWDITNSRSERTIDTGRKYAGFLSFSPDGKALISATADAGATVWDVASGAKVRALDGTAGWLHCTALSPDGKTFAVGGDDGRLGLWDTASGRKTATMAGHTDLILAVQFSPDGKTLLSSSADKTMRIWDAASGKNTTTIPCTDGDRVCVAFSPDGGTIACGGDNTSAVRLWNVRSRKEVADVDACKDGDVVICLAFSPDGKILASGSYSDGNVLLWDVNAAAAQPGAASRRD